MRYPLRRSQGGDNFYHWMTSMFDAGRRGGGRAAERVWAATRGTVDAAPNSA
ncbi:MAG: hypothetical protein R2851_03900 [Caldilineaceae bacterium]